MIIKINLAFFLISNKVSGLLNQLQILQQLYLIEFLGLLMSLGLLKLQYLTYSRFSPGFVMLLCFTKSRLIKFRVRYLVLSHLLSVLDSFKWFWMRSLYKNIQLMTFLMMSCFLEFWQKFVIIAGSNLKWKT